MSAAFWGIPVDVREGALDLEVGDVFSAAIAALIGPPILRAWKVAEIRGDRARVTCDGFDHWMARTIDLADFGYVMRPAPRSVVITPAALARLPRATKQ